MHSRTASTGTRKAYTILFFALALFLSFIYPACLEAQPRHSTFLNPDTPYVVVGKRMELLEDPSANMQIAQIRAREGWYSSDSVEPNMGFTKSAWWARFTLHIDQNDDDSFFLLVDDAIVNQIDVYFYHNKETPVHYRGGGWIPLSQRDQPYRAHLFSIPGEGPPASQLLSPL
jgi:hypothetical protein